MAGTSRYNCSSSGGSSSSCSEDDDDDDEGEGESTWDEDEDACSSCSTAEADDAPRKTPKRRRRTTTSRDDACAVAAAAAATAPDLLDARRLADLLDPERLVAVLDGWLGSEYVRGCVVETWDETLGDHLEAVAHLVLYHAAEHHAVSQYVYEQLTELAVALRPPAAGPAQRERLPATVDADRVYGTLRSAARALLATRADACCRQAMCRAVGLAVAALRASTRPVFSVENFTVEINEAADFANLYCTAYARRICAALGGIYDAVMAGEYHPTGVLVQMAVMEKSIRAALRTLADARATAAQKTAAQRSLLAELQGICATVRMKNHGCVQQQQQQQHAEPAKPAEDEVVLWARAPPAAARFVHFTMSPWRAPISMYHRQSPVSVDRVLKSTVRLVETLVAELFKPCLSARPLRRRGHAHHRRPRRDVHEKQL